MRARWPSTSTPTASGAGTTGSGDTVSPCGGRAHQGRPTGAAATRRSRSSSVPGQAYSGCESTSSLRTGPRREPLTSTAIATVNATTQQDGEPDDQRRRPVAPGRPDQHGAEDEHDRDADGDLGVVADDEVVPEAAEAPDEAASCSMVRPPAGRGHGGGRGPAPDVGTARRGAARPPATPSSSTGRARSSPGHSSGSFVGAEDAQALERPEGAEGREQQPDDVLQRVLGDLGQRPVEGRAGGQHDHGRDERGTDGDRHVAGAEAERDHDEDDLDPLEEHALERDDEGEPVQAEPALGRRLPGGRRRGAELLLLVVQALEAARAQHRLAQPLEAEDEHQPTDQQLERRLGQPRGQRVAGHGGEHREREQGRDDSGHRRAPPTGEADRQHDGQGLDQLDDGGDEDRDGEGPFGGGQHRRFLSRCEGRAMARGRSPCVIGIIVARVAPGRACGDAKVASTPLSRQPAPVPGQA